jgi:hypothetical protein
LAIVTDVMARLHSVASARTSVADHSGSPAFRNASAYLAKSSGRNHVTRFLRLELRNSGSS